MDLDDGTLIHALGSKLNRDRSNVFPYKDPECDLGTGFVWDHDEEL